MNEKNIIIFLDEIEMKIFSFINQQDSIKKNFFTFDNFFYENLDYIQKILSKKFEYKNFGRIDFDFCFYNMLNFIAQKNYKLIEIFLSQKKIIKQIFDYFYICKSSNISDSELKQEFSNLSNLNFSNEFFINCYEIFNEIDNFLFKKNKIYKENALIHIIKFCKSNSQIIKFKEFINFFIKNFKNIEFFNIKSFEQKFEFIQLKK